MSFALININSFLFNHFKFDTEKSNSLSSYVSSWFNLFKSDKTVKYKTSFINEPTFVHTCVVVFLNHHDLASLINTSHACNRIFNTNIMWETDSRRFYPQKDTYNQGLEFLATPKALIEFQYACNLIEVIKRLLFQSEEAISIEDADKKKEWLKKNRDLVKQINNVVFENNINIRKNNPFRYRTNYSLTRFIWRKESWDPSCILLAKKLRSLLNFNPIPFHQKVDLSYNFFLRELPQEITYLISKECKILNLSYNFFDFFPKIIFSFTQIKHLELAYSSIKEIPDEIANLTHLQCLDLSHNMLVQLNEKVCLLTELIILKLNSNYLSVLPEQIQYLKKLNRLELQENPNLKTLPLSIKEIESLKELKVDYKMNVPKGFHARSVVFYRYR